MQKPKLWDYTRCQWYCLKRCLRPKRCWQGYTICCQDCNEYLICLECGKVCFQGEGRKT